MLVADFWELGCLTRADRWTSNFGESDERDWLVAVEFVFQHGGLVVEAVPEDDTVAVHLPRDGLIHWGDESTRSASAHPAVGCGVRWAWSLTNHQGYVDGFQIEFTTDQPRVHQQFTTIASRLVEFDIVSSE